MSDNERLDKLEQTVKALGEALIERTEQDRLRSTEFTQSLASISQALTQMREETATGDISPKLANYVASQFGALFQNHVALDSLASAILGRLQSALEFRASTSSERQPQLVLQESYLPGAWRVMLTETGELSLEQQLKDSVGDQEGWEVHPWMEDASVVEPIKQLLASYGVDADRYYYMTDDITLQNYRENLTRQVSEREAHDARERALQSSETSGVQAEDKDFEDFPQVDLPKEQPSLQALDRLKDQLDNLNPTH